MNLPANSDSSQQQEILDSLPVLIFLEREGRIVFANAEARQLLGVAEERWTARPVEEVLWGLFPGTAEPQTHLTGGSSASPFHATMPNHAGRLFPVEGTYCLVNGDPQEAVIVAQTTGRERAPKPRLMEDVLASLPEAVAIVHGSHVLYTNAAFTRMFGYSTDEVSGGNLRDFIVPETRHHEAPMLQKALEDEGRASIETVRITKTGELVDVAMHMGPLMVGGARAGHVLTYSDIGDRKRVEATLRHDALHDVLTGLPNRSLFEDRVNFALARRVRRREPGCGVLVVCLDNFKEVNRARGHAAGDALTVLVAQRLASLLRPHDTAARLGSDDFAVLLEGILSVGDLDAVAGRILAGFAKPFEVQGQPFIAKTSIGAAMAGPDTGSAESLLRDAEFAMHHARQGAGPHYEVFDRRLGAPLDSLQERERQLSYALSNRRFELLYEPVYRLATGQLEWFESSLHLRKTNGAIDSFTDMFSVAEETGLSISIGREVLDSICRQLKSWRDALPDQAITLALNLTHRQFYHDDMVPQLKRILNATGVDPTCLIFEIPEIVVNENPDAALATLQRMADCGVRLALDNFGSGMAPLNHLVRLPFDVVKMDPLLTVATTTKGRQLALVESLIHLSKSVGVQLVGQGIETEEQLVALRALGCELGQGRLPGEPVDSMRALEIAVEHHHALIPHSGA